MIYLIIAVSIIALYLLIVFLSSHKIIASAVITSGHGKVETKLKFDKNNKRDLFALALCYAIKIKWVILSEQDCVNKTFNNLINETNKDWPIVPYVEMLSSIKKESTIYKINLYNSGKRYSLNNYFPKVTFAGDLATNYFFLLKEIVKELNDDEKETLQRLFLSLKDDILNLNDKSVFALQRHINKINDTLNPSKKIKND